MKNVSDHLEPNEVELKVLIFETDRIWVDYCLMHEKYSLFLENTID